MAPELTDYQRYTDLRVSYLLPSRSSIAPFLRGKPFPYQLAVSKALVATVLEAAQEIHILLWGHYNPLDHHTRLPSVYRLVGEVEVVVRIPLVLSQLSGPAQRDSVECS